MRDFRRVRQKRSSTVHVGSRREGTSSFMENGPASTAFQNPREGGAGERGTIHQLNEASDKKGSAVARGEGWEKSKNKWRRIHTTRITSTSEPRKGIDRGIGWKGERGFHCGTIGWTDWDRRQKYCRKGGGHRSEPHEGGS